MNDLLLNGHDPVLVGIVNVTPDSFSDGGRHFLSDLAIAHGKRLIGEGAHILDIGGESTRPGAEPVSVEDELRRVLPVIGGLKDCGAVISIDTRNAETMRQAIAAGARMVNDVTALTHAGGGAVDLVAKAGVYVCLMHMKGDPQSMQDDPHYDDVFTEVYEYLLSRIGACRARGIQMGRIIADVGIGFGKTVDHNLILLNRMKEFESLGVSLMLGASRKRFIASVSGGSEPAQRDAGSIAAAIAAWQRGVKIFRVHDVAATKQALDVYRAITGICG